MKTKSLLLSLLLILPAKAATPDPAAKIDIAFKEAATYEFGKGDAAIKAIADAVLQAAKEQDPAKREAVEKRVLAALDAATTRDAKDFLFRQLLVSSSPAAIPKLESLLADQDLAHLARYALARMQYPEASAALQRALAKATGKLQAGIINSLAARRYKDALPDIAKLLNSTDPLVAQAAISALGDIGGEEGVKLLQAARTSASTENRPRIDFALLAAADALATAGQQPQATTLYTQLYTADHPKAVCLGALRGLAQAQGETSTNLLLQAIKGSDPLIAASAIGFTRTIKSPGLSKTLIDLLPSLAPVLQEDVIRALADRNDPAASAAITAAAKNEQANVRVAALEVLGDIGDVSAVPILAAAATGPADEQRVARDSLARLKGDRVSPAIKAAIAAAEPKTKVELVRALAARKGATTAEFFKLAEDADSGVRRESILGLGAVVADAEVPLLVNLTIKPKEPGDRGAIEEAVAAASRRLGDPKKRTQLLVDTLATAPADAKPSIIRLFKSVASPEALDALKAAIQDADKPIVDAAVRTLADWPDASGAADLYAFAKATTNPTQKILAIRGYVRQAGQSPAPVPMYEKAMELAERPDEKKVILSGLGGQNSLAALQLAQRYLKDEALQAEAGQAIIQIAGRLKGKDADTGKEALKEVAGIAKDSKVARQAADILNPPKKEEKKDEKKDETKKEPTKVAPPVK